MSQEQDQKFFRNYALIIGVLAVMILIFFILAQIIGSDEEMQLKQRADAVAERTAPEGQVNIAGQTPTAVPAPVATPAAEHPAAAPASASATVAAGGDETAKRVYSGLCITCHGQLDGSGGVPNVPHIGDKAAWATRIAQGQAVLYEHALKGYTGASGMPMLPKGGNPALSDDEVKAAVDFMVSNSQ